MMRIFLYCPIDIPYGQWLVSVHLGAMGFYAVIGTRCRMVTRS